MLLTGLGRSVLGETVPSVTRSEYRPLPVLKTSGTVSPNADLPAGENIYFCHKRGTKSTTCYFW